MTTDLNTENTESEREIIEDTPENRAWIGETQPQPLEDKASEK